MLGIVGNEGATLINPAQGQVQVRSRSRTRAENRNMGNHPNRETATNPNAAYCYLVLPTGTQCCLRLPTAAQCQPLLPSVSYRCLNQPQLYIQALSPRSIASSKSHQFYLYQVRLPNQAQPQFRLSSNSGSNLDKYILQVQIYFFILVVVFSQQQIKQSFSVILSALKWPLSYSLL